MADKIEKSIQKAVDAMTPDLYERLAGLSEAPEDRYEKIVPVKNKSSKKKRKWIYSAAGVAAAFIMTMGLGWHQLLAADSVVSLDVNPSLEFVINRQNRVTEVKTYNRDAKKVVKSLDLKNVEVQTAVSAVLGSMLQEGYIDGKRNTVLLSVQNENKEKAAALEKNLISDIDGVLEGAGKDGRLVSQILEEDSELKKLAGEHHVSSGKMQLIQNILLIDKEHSVEELSKMSVQKLMELIGDEQLNLHGHMNYEEDDFCHKGHKEEGENQDIRETPDSGSKKNHHKEHE